LIGSAALARRYASALFGLAESNNQAETMLAQITELTDLARENAELERVLFTPLYPRAERRAVLNALARKLELHPHVRGLLLVMIDENRMALLTAVRDGLRVLVDRAAGRVEAQVISARDLDSATVARLKQALSQRVNAEVTLSLAVNPDLIGGVVVRVGDLLLDGSVRTQLASLGENLRQGV
jgi:F-type H+-transporting ATPase subunit delta